MLGCGAPTHFPHLPHLTFPYISPYLPHTPTHFPTSPLIPLPTSPFLPPHPNTLSYYPHISPLTFSKCDEVSVAKLLWRSYHAAKSLATVWNPYFKKDAHLLESIQKNSVVTHDVFIRSNIPLIVSISLVLNLWIWNIIPVD